MWQLLASLSPLIRRFVQQLLGSKARPDHQRSRVEISSPYCTCLAFSHGRVPGGVSEIGSLLKKAMGAGPDGDDGSEILSVTHRWIWNDVSVLLLGSWDIYSENFLSVALNYKSTDMSSHTVTLFYGYNIRCCANTSRRRSAAASGTQTIPAWRPFWTMWIKAEASLLHRLPAAVRSSSWWEFSFYFCSLALNHLHVTPGMQIHVHKALEENIHWPLTCPWSYAGPVSAAPATLRLPRTFKKKPYHAVFLS